MGEQFWEGCSGASRDSIGSGMLSSLMTQFAGLSVVMLITFPRP